MSRPASIAILLLFAGPLAAAPLATQADAPANNPPATETQPTAPAADPTAAPPRHVGGAVQPPTLLRKVDPQFPAQLRQMGTTFQGIVLVNLIVDTNGMPQSVHVLRGPGMGLNEAALEAVKQYRFRPATENGKPVPVELNVEVNFQIYNRAQLPKVLHSVKLEPTDEARQNHAGGAILLGFTIDVFGNPENIRVVRGFGMGMDERAIETLKQYKFKPFQNENGQPAPRETTLELTFKAK